MAIIDLKTVSKLLGEKFSIPSYQRGYRWTKQQVTDLLDDICDFEPQKNEWYCLQPLVVKRKGDDEWEVVDGQQRLTTIFLIIHYINQKWVGEDKFNEPIITYETREQCHQFLNDMKVQDNNVTIDDSNIDYLYISSAYHVINNWVNEKKKVSFDRNEFQSKFKEKTKVIWYEVESEQDGRDIFSRINKGKISLNNAELIKALFLNSSNFNTDDQERIRLKQLEIVTEWDAFEAALHDEEFWLFINQYKNEKDARIEFLFELSVGKPTKQDDSYFTFREFHKKFKDNNEETITNNWKEIKRIFQTLYNWFKNRELYHKIGFLITLGEDIKDLIMQSQSETKSEYIKLIDERIKSKFAKLQIDELEYGNVNIKNILLMHNIQTMLNNENETSRFPFNRYKNEKWDVEHIHATATEPPKDEKHQKEWLEEAKNFLPNDFEVELSNENFVQLYANILNYFNEDSHYDSNYLSNLALLDSKTNRGYKNVIFPAKREEIIEREKKGTFMPICTKNVFMKYYSDKIGQMYFWGEADRESYLKNIKETLASYLPAEVTNEQQ